MPLQKEESQSMTGKIHFGISEETTASRPLINIQAFGLPHLRAVAAAVVNVTVTVAVLH